MFKFRFFLFKHGWYAVIYSAIITIGYFNDRLFETLLLFACYITLRYTTPKTFHSNNFYTCIFWSIVMFFVAIPNTMSVESSVLSSVGLGICIAVILHYVQDYFDKKADNVRLEAENYALTNESKVNINTLDEKSLREYATACGLTVIQNDVLIYLKIHKYRIVDVCKTLGYGRTTIKYHIKEIKKKLKINKI